jgi:hypothetical protein
MGEVAPARSARILATAGISIEADAMGEAALAADWEESRFRCYRIMEQAFELRSRHVADAVRNVRLSLGPPGGVPDWGCGAAMIELSDAIGRLLEGA